MKYGRYEVEKELGRGAMGVVWQAHDPQIDRRVALKVLRPELVTSEAFVQRFLKEAKAIGRLSHPQIVTVYDVGRDQGTIYIAMELLDGDPFNEVMRQREFTEGEIARLGMQVAEVLGYAHQNGIVHRDIKPSNIIFTSNDQIKMTDFGIARIEDPSAPQMTRAGEVLGTPAYMSPEQVAGQPVDGRSDLYSLGVLLYELSAGTRPFKGKDVYAILFAVTQDTPPEPAKANPSVAPELSRIIMKCLNKAPEARFQTGQELVHALEGFVEASQPAETVVLQTKKASRSLHLLIVIALLLASAVGGLSYHFITNRATEAPWGEVDAAKKSVLMVKTNPAGAQVFVDGGFKGATPLQLQLPLGKHDVRLTLPDHHEWEAQIDLAEEGETPLFVRLIPLDW